MPLTDLTRYPGNARRGSLPEIRSSIRRNGQYRALVVRRHGSLHTILAGNHTADALAAEGHENARCEVITCTDDEARRINLADNRTAELGDYDDRALAAALAALDGDYDGTGWTEEDLTGLAYDGHPGSDGYGDGEPGDDEDKDEGDGITRGELLALAGVTIGEPRHQVEDGQAWQLGPHVLVVTDLFTGWPAWTPFLTAGAVFLPYPTPLAPHAPGYTETTLVMVQPEHYLAGHLLDKWEDITGDTPVLTEAEDLATAV